MSAPHASKVPSSYRFVRLNRHARHRWRTGLVVSACNIRGSLIYILVVTT